MWMSQRVTSLNLPKTELLVFFKQREISIKKKEIWVKSFSFRETEGS